MKPKLLSVFQIVSALIPVSLIAASMVSGLGVDFYSAWGGYLALLVLLGVCFISWTAAWTITNERNARILEEVKVLNQKE